MYTEEDREELLNIIKKAATGKAILSNREAAILYHWIHHINDIEFAWVPEEYKKDMPQYRGNN